MSRSQFVPFGEWLPDQPGSARGCSVALNVIPQANGYRSARGLSSTVAALDKTALAAIWCKTSAGVVKNFSATSDALYLKNLSAQDDVSKAGGYSTTSWEFTQWGDRVIAVAPGETPQYFDMLTSTEFDDLAGTPPEAEHIAVVRDFVVMGKLVESGGSFRNRVRWSGYNNSEIWTSSPATQSDYQDLLGRGGDVQRIIGGAAGVIFQEHAIVVMTYTGPPTIFRFDEVEGARGTSAPWSVCQSGSGIFYWGHDGFYMFDGNASVPIGSEKVNRWVVEDISAPRAYNEMFGAVDRQNQLVMWTYPSRSNGRYVIVYHWPTQRWSLIDVDVEYLFEFASEGYTLDTLDTILADIDSESIPVDSTEYLGGAVSMGAFGTNHRMSVFAGDALQAQVETGDFYAGSDRSVFVEQARALVEGANASVALSHAQRDDARGNYTFSTPSAANAYGEFSVLMKGRYHRYRLTIDDYSPHIVGITIKHREAGRR